MIATSPHATASTIRRRIRFGVVCALPLLSLSLPVRSPAQDGPTKIGEELNRLHAVVQSDASSFDKTVACKRLAVIGTKESVPILASLLSNEELSHAARLGLEAIPDPAAARPCALQYQRSMGDCLLA